MTVTPVITDPFWIRQKELQKGNLKTRRGLVCHWGEVPLARKREDYKRSETNDPQSGIWKMAWHQCKIICCGISQWLSNRIQASAWRKQRSEPGGQVSPQRNQQPSTHQMRVVVNLIDRGHHRESSGKNVDQWNSDEIDKESPWR